MKRWLLIVALLFPSVIFAQGARIDNPGGPAQRLVQGFMAPIPGATITVCTSSATGTPCTPVVPTSPVTLCTDATCSTAAPNPFTADASGNFGFWAVPGTYKVSVTATGVTGYLLTVTLPCVGGSTCVATSANNTFTGNNTHSGTETFSNINGTTVVDGTTYPLTAAGIASAISARSTAGGGRVLLQPAGKLPIYTGSALVPTGTPIPMGSTTITVPSNVILEGQGPAGSTVLQWTATPSGAHGAGIYLASATQHAGISNLTLDFTAAATGAVGISADADATHITAYNTFRNVFINYEALTSGTAAIYVPATLASFSFNLNYFDNVHIFLAAQGVVCQSCEGNFWKIDIFNSGNGALQVFQELQANDEIIDARIESGSSTNGTNGICYGNTGQGSIVRMTCDTGAAGWTALADAPAAGGNTYQVSLIGTATLGTLHANSTATVNQAAAGNKFIVTSPTLNGTPTGTGISTLTLKKGSGGGNYTNATTSYTVADSTNLCYTVTIPTGWKLGISMSGNLGTATAAVVASYALTDNSACSTANAGVLVEGTVTGTGATVLEPIALNWVITGDGAAHNIALQFKTSNAADSATLANSTATLTPTIKFELMPSN